MTLKILIDMNLSPDWVDALRSQGLHALVEGWKGRCTGLRDHDMGEDERPHRLHA